MSSAKESAAPYNAAFAHFVLDEQTKNFNAGYFQLPRFPEMEYLEMGARSLFHISINIDEFDVEPFRFALKHLRPECATLPSDSTPQQMLDQLEFVATYLNSQETASKQYSDRLNELLSRKSTVSEQDVADSAIEILDFASGNYTNILLLLDWILDSPPSSQDAAVTGVCSVIMCAFSKYAQCTNVHWMIATGLARCAFKRPGVIFPELLVRFGAFATALSWIRNAYCYKVQLSVYSSRPGVRPSISGCELTEIMEGFDKHYGFSKSVYWLAQSGECLECEHRFRSHPAVGPVGDPENFTLIF